jgi:hypothetical protein
MGKQSKRLKKKKDREKRVKIKMAKRREAIRYEAKLEKEARDHNWRMRETIIPIRNPDKEKK